MNQPRLKVPLILLIALVLHTAVMGHLRVAGVAPDVMVLIPIVAGLAAGPERGAAFGFACGLAVDLVIGLFVDLGTVPVHRAVRGVSAVRC